MNDKYQIGTVINNFEIIDYVENNNEVRSDKHNRVKVRCTKCGHIIEDISTSNLCKLKNDGPCKHIKIRGWEPRLRNLYNKMIYACTRPGTSSYKNYGGKGIKVCDEWLNNPDSFRAWALQNGYNDSTALKRVDEMADFCPDNCYWKDGKVKSRTANNSTRKKAPVRYISVTIDNETRSLSEWERILQMPEHLFTNYADTHTMRETCSYIARYKSNKNIKTDISARYITIGDETKSLSEWSRYFGYNPSYFSCIRRSYGEETMKKKLTDMLNAKKEKEHDTSILPDDTANATSVNHTTDSTNVTHVNNPYDKFALGNIINNFEILEEQSRSEDNHRRFKIKCTRCGIILENVPSNRLLHTKNTKCKHVRVSNWHNDRLRGIYNKMVYRCTKETNLAFFNYGARGIKVCEDWLLHPDNFKDWALANGYRDDLTIDRINSNGNYCPENCRWIPLEENVKWHHNTKKIVIDGITDTIKGWSDRLHVCYDKFLDYSKTHTLKQTTNFIKQHKDGENPKDDHKPGRRDIFIEIDGISQTLADWAKYFGKSHSFFTGIKFRKGNDAMLAKLHDMYEESKGSK